MQLVERHIIKDDRFMDICVKSKNLYNQSLYYWRQSIFGKIQYFSEYELTKLFAEYDEENYRDLPAPTSQQISFLIDGKGLKSINQGFNKTRGKMKSILPLLPKRYKTKTGNRIQKGTSNKIQALTQNRNNRVNDYIHKASRLIINEAKKQNITKIIIGKNEKWKQNIDIGVKNNTSFCSIPHAALIDKIRYKAQMEGIEVILTQEAYTSKCSAIDLEPVKKQQTYVGKRVKRGLFRTGNGLLINADCNGSLNIARLGLGLSGLDLSALSVSGNEIEISESLVRCVSQPKKVNVLDNKTKLLEQLYNR